MPGPQDWIDRHAEALFRYALLQTRDREAAEECVQETFVSALGARDAFRGQATERTWLVGILRHKICDHFRRRQRERPTDDPEAEARVAAMFTAGGDWRESPQRWPDWALAREEFWADFRNCLAKLPPRMGDLFCLREIQGLNAPEICKVMEISETNLWVQLHRARVLLRRCLEQAWGMGGS